MSNTVSALHSSASRVLHCQISRLVEEEKQNTHPKQKASFLILAGFDSHGTGKNLFPSDFLTKNKNAVDEKTQCNNII